MFAGAAFTDESDIQAKDAVNMLTALGVIEGDPDGSFRPDATVTRAEMAKMIFVVRNNSIDDSAYANTASTLTDINSHWAKGYIKFCESQGIIAGYGDGTFKPDATVTGTEAAKMLLVLAGYEPSKAGLEGHNWATNTLKYAGAAGILDDVASGLESGLPRQYAAQMIYNALDTDRVKWSTDSQSFDNILNGGVKETVGKAYMGLYSSVGTLVSVDKDSLTLTGIDAAESDAISSSTDNNGNVTYKYATDFTKVSSDYSALMGQKVKVMFKDGKTNSVLGVYPLADNEVYTVVANGTSKDGDKVKFNDASHSVELTNGGIKTYIDGQLADPTTLSDLDANTLNPNMYTFVDSNGNGKIDTLIVKTYNVAKVTYAASDKIIANGKTYKYADENIADDIAKDDWIVITENLFDDCKDIAKADVATGTLDALRDGQNKNVYFDGASNTVAAQYDEYQIGDEWFMGGNRLQSTTSENDLNAVKAGDSVEYVAVNGIMFYVKKASGDNTGKVDNVALVVKKDGTGVADRVKLAFFDGTTKTVDVDDDNSNSIAFSALGEGVVYEYAVSGDEYSFYTLQEGVNNKKYEEYYGDLTFRGATTVNALTGGSADKYSIETIEGGSFDGLKIDDKAEILLFNDTSKTTAQITGKQLKSIADLDDIDGSGNGLASVVAYAFSGDMSGLNRIGALALEVDGATNLSAISSQTWSNYAFILSDAKWVVRNKTMEYTIWTGTETLTVQEDHNTLTDRKARTVIGYDKLTTGDTNVIDDVQLLDSGIANFHMDAITDVSNDGKTIKLANGPELDISDATILYVDSDGKAGMTAEEGVVKEAITDFAGKYLANALYINVGTDAELLVVDQLTYLKSDYYETNLSADFTGKVIYGGDAVTGNEKTVAFAGVLPTLTVNQPVDQTITINTTNIANGNIVAAQLTDSTGNNTVTNGTLAVSNGTVSGNTATIKLTGTPANNTTDVYIKVTVDGQSKLSSKLTINAAQSNTVLKLAGTDNKSLVYAAAGNFTVTAGYQNAWMQELKVSIKDSDNGDATSKFTTAFTTGGIIADNNAGTDTLTITEKSGAAIGTYTATVTLGDKSESFTFAVTASEIADANNLTFTLASDPTNSDTPDSLAVTPAKGGSEHYTVTSTKWFNGENEVTGSNQLKAGTIKLVIELKADANYKFASNATTTKQAGASNKTATPVVAEDGSTLTLTYEWTVV